MSQFEAEADDPVAQRKLLVKMQLPLIASQDIGDDKIQIVQTLTDTIENKTRQLEHDSQNLDFGRGEDEDSPVKVKKESDKEKSGGKRRKNKDEDYKENDTTGVSSSKAGTPNGKKVKKSGTVKAGPGGAERGAGTTSGPPGSTAGPKRTGGKKGGPERGGAGGRDRSNSPPDLPIGEIDPDEPTYCLCDQVCILYIILA